jgi:hypothetical protein
MKPVGSEETTFVYDGFGNLAAEMTTGAPSGAPGATYLSGDHLGSTRVTTDAGGLVRNYFDYTPFGEELGSGMNSRPTYAVNTYPAGAAVGPSQKFTGKERDGVARAISWTVNLP